MSEETPNRVSELEAENARLRRIIGFSRRVVEGSSSLHRPNVEGIVAHGEVARWPNGAIQAIAALVTYIQGLEVRRVVTYFAPAEASAHAAIVGALRTTIDAHGPITPETIGSAAKRVHGSLLSLGCNLERDSAA